MLELLLMFSERRPSATVAELTAELGVPPSTCYRYVSLLREMGLLAEGDAGVYYVAPRIWTVAGAATAANTLGRIAWPVLQRLAAETDEIVMVLRPIEDSAVCVERIESSQAFRISYQPGHALPLHAGASGKSLLAHLSPRRRDSYLDAYANRDPEFAAHRPALERELAEIARRGWSESCGEVDDGVRACSAAITDQSGGAVATVTIAAPTHRVTPERHEQIRRLVLDAASEIATLLKVNGAR